MADVAVPERQVVATQHLGSAAPASAGQARVRPGFHLGPADRRAVDRGIERVLDRDDLLAFMPSMGVQVEQLQTPETEDINDVNTTERHISMFFRDPEEQWQLLSPYLVDHLSSGAPAIYLQHHTSTEQLLQRLQYDLKLFTGDVILDALMTHPTILISSGLAPGFYGIAG